MDIGTSKVSKKDQQRIKHYLIDILEPGQPFSAGKFEEMGDQILNEVFKKLDVAILCGGTAFYIESLLYGLDNFPTVSNEIKLGLEDDLEKLGLPVLVEELKGIDPELADKMDLNNHRRVLRALGIYRQTGKSPSSFFNKKKKELNYQPIFILLMPDREELYEKINSRVDDMMSDGLEEEARFIFAKYPEQFFSTVGYAEFKEYFDGNMPLEEVVELIKRNTRRYAKRQMTWFRGKNEWNQFHPNEKVEIFRFVNRQLNF